MRWDKLALVLLLVAASLLAVPGAAATPKPAPRGSFLRYEVSSVDGLTNQIRGDQAVASRFAKHYGLPVDTIVRSFQQNLHYKTLTQPLKTTVYGVSKSGRIHGKTRTLKAGTPVFVDSNGRIVLKGRCGNPVSKYMPQVLAVVPQPEVVTKVLPQPPEIVPPPEETVPAVVPALAEAETPPVAAAVPSEPVFLSPGVLAGVAAIPALLGLGAFKNDAPTVVVPEPQAWFILSAGLTTVAAGLAAKRRSR